MSDERFDTSNWLARATRGIRFKPDREAVLTELREHIEDKSLDYQRIFPGMTWEEARQRAVSEMGDPEEIGRELARIHKPWLGYLWTVSKVALGLAAVAAVIAGMSGLMAGGAWLRIGDGLKSTHPEARVTWVEPCSDRIYVDGDLVLMTEAARMQFKEELRVGAVLRTVSPFFWERENYNLCRRIRAVDSLGNEYPSYEERWGTWGDNAEEWNYVNGHGDGCGPFHKDYPIWVYGVDPKAEWVRLEYDWMDRSFSMTIDIKEGDR